MQVSFFQVTMFYNARDLKFGSKCQVKCSCNIKVVKKCSCWQVFQDLADMGASCYFVKLFIAELLICDTVCCDRKIAMTIKNHASEEGGFVYFRFTSYQIAPKYKLDKSHNKYSKIETRQKLVNENLQQMSFNFNKVLVNVSCHFVLH